MAEKKYELSSAYVSILPSLAGLSDELRKQLSVAMPSMRDSLSSALQKSFSGASTGIGKLTSRLGSAISTGAGKAIRGAGKLLTDTFTTAGRTAGLALTTGVGAIGAQVVAGGFSRALGLNEAEASLKALGYSAGELDEIMQTASDSIDGTAYTLDAAVGASTAFLSAGITDQEELLSVLENTSKLADISGRSFEEMGQIMSKNAASGIVQWGDMVQIMDAGVPIQAELAKAMGITGQEVRDMASAGEISFADFNKAVQQIEFDSALYAAENATLAFSNVRAQLSRVGENLWTPLIDGAGPVFVQIRGWLADLQNNTAFTDLMERWANSVEKMYSRIQPSLDKVTDIFSSAESVSGFFDDFEDKTKSFRKNIEGMEGPVIGLGIALGSSLLSQLPIVGSMFGTIGIGVGILGGAFGQIIADSDMLQASLGGLIDSIGSLFTGADFSTEGMLGEIGDTLAGIVDQVSSFIESSGDSIDFGGILGSVLGGINAFLGVIADRGPEISDSITGLFGSIGDAFGKAEGMGIGDGLANTLVSLFTGVLGVVEGAIPVISNVLSLLTGIVTSDFVVGAFDVLVNLAEWVLSNEALLTTAAIALGTMFVAKKVAGPISAMMTWFQGFGKGGAAKAVGGKGIIASMTTGIQGLGALGLAALKASPGIMAGIAAIGLWIGEVALISWIMEETGGFNALLSLTGFIGDLFTQMTGTLVENGIILAAGIGIVSGHLATAIDNIWPVVEPILTFVLGGLLAALDTYASNFNTLAETVLTGITDIISAFGDSATAVSDGIGSLVDKFSQDGVQAGVGAGAMATGLFALSGALAALAAGNIISTVTGGFSGLWDSFKELMSGDDKSNQLMVLAETFQRVDSIIGKMPETWAAVSTNAFTAGRRIIGGLESGMQTQLSVTQSSILREIRSMMNRIQNEINSTQLYIQAPRMRGGSIPGYGGGGGTTVNNNTNINANTQNSRVLDQILNAAR